MINKNDNIYIKRPEIVEKIEYKYTIPENKHYISQDNRPEYKKKQDQSNAQLGYNKHIEDKNIKEGTEKLIGFMNFIDYAGLATGVGSLASKGISKAGKAVLKKGAIGRLRDTNRAKSAFQEYISPFGYQLFNSYDGKIPEVGRFIKGYVIQGKDAPKTPWHVRRMAIEPERTINRQEALRLYMGNPKPTDNLYIKNTDGTYRYNPDRIPNKNIEYQRKVFQEAGNGNSAQEYLTTTLNGPKGTRPGNAGGVTSIIDDNGNFIIDDTWDLNPLKRFKWLPKPIRNFEAGKLIGAKPFRVYDDKIGKVLDNKP